MQKPQTVCILTGRDLIQEAGYKGTGKLSEKGDTDNPILVNAGRAPNLRNTKEDVELSESGYLKKGQLMGL